MMADRGWSTPVSEDRIERAAAALRANHIEAVVVGTGADAKREVLARIPDGAEVHSGASKSLQMIGLIAELESSPKITWLRKQLATLDRATQMREIRKLSAAPDVMLASATAVTEDGQIVVASNTGSQIGPLASAAGKVIFVIGAQKIVKDLDEALKRTYEHALRLESERLRAASGVDSYVSKMLIVNREARPGRTTVILVNEPLGV
jgi:L-lactate utilization protein LutC